MHTIKAHILTLISQISIMLVREMLILKSKGLCLLIWLLFKFGVFICAVSHTFLAMELLYPDASTLHTAGSIVLLLYAVLSFTIVVVLCKMWPLMVRSLENMKLNDEGMFEHTDSYVIDSINVLKESILVLSPENIILRGNSISANLFGLDFVGHNIQSLIHIDDVAVFQNAMKEVLESEDACTRTVEYRVRNHANNEASVTVQDTYLPSRGGDATAAQYTWVESTLCKGMSSFHGSTNSRNDINVKVHSRNVDNRKKNALFQHYFEMTKEQERVNEAKMRYISCIAHDLKTPLQSFCFTVDLLQNTEVTPEQAELLSHTTVAVDLMKLTISQTMDISKALTGAKLMPRRSLVHLSSIIDRVSIIM